MLKIYTEGNNKIGIFKSNELITSNASILDKLILNNDMVILLGINSWGILVKNSEEKEIKIKYSDISDIKIV